jgi:hypothetical protein
MSKAIRQGLCAVVLVLACVPFFVGAQQQSADAPVSSTTDNQLYVDEIQVAGGTFGPEETVTGSFMLYNVSDTVLSGVSYRIELVKLAVFEESLVISEPLLAGPMSTQAAVAAGGVSVPFSFTLPKQLPVDGGLGLLVQTYEQGGTPSGYEVIEISIDTTKGTTFLPFEAMVSVNGSEVYETLEGPTVSADEQITLDVRLVNTTATAVTLAPTLRVVTGGTSAGEPVYERTLDFFTIAAGQTAHESITLPLDLDPGVYTATLSFADSAGKTAVTPIDARYIVAGLQPKIEQVRYSSTDIAAAADVFTVHVSYMDVPLNIRVSADGTFQDPRAAYFFASTTEANEYERSLQGLLPEGMSARITLADPTTGKIFEQQHVGFLSGTAEANATFTGITNTDSVYVEVVLLERGEAIDTFGETLVVTTRTSKNVVATFWNNHPLGFIALVLLVVLGFWFRWLITRQQAAMQVTKK